MFVSTLNFYTVKYTPLILSGVYALHAFTNFNNAGNMEACKKKQKKKEGEEKC